MAAELEREIDPEWNLPPKPIKWPTAEELRQAALEEENPVESLKELRRRVPLAGPETLSIRLRS